MTIYLIDNNELLLVIRSVILHSTADTLLLSDRKYEYTNVLHEASHESLVDVLHRKFLIQKLAFKYRTDLNFPPLVKSMFFFNFLIFVLVHKSFYSFCFLR
jgi:hypothetical protein